MAVPKKPHTVQVYPVTEPIDATTKIVQAPQKGDPVEVACFHWGGTPGEHFDQRTGVALSNPEVLLCDPEDGESFAYGYRVVDTDTGQEFVVKNKPRPSRGWEDAAPIDHQQIEMEELEFT